MTCRLASIEPISHAYVCACGDRTADSDTFHGHLFGPTLAELVFRVERGWAELDRSWSAWQLERDRLELHRETWPECTHESAPARAHDARMTTPVEKPHRRFTRATESVMVD